jgi:outer membrane protein TolC
MPDVTRRLSFALMITLLLAPSAVFGQAAPVPAPQPPSQPAAGALRRLSIDEAVRLALEQNLSLQVQRLNPQIQELAVTQAKTFWTPQLSSTISNANSTSPISSFLSGASSQLVSKNFRASVQESQSLPWYGSNYSVAWTNTRNADNSVFSSPNPSLASSLEFSFTQPLLRNFKIDGNRQQVLISKKNREMSDVQLRQTVLATVRNVKSAYWDLAYAFDNLKVQQQSLDIARESLRDNKSRVAVGTMAPIDIVEAEAEVARNEEAVIVAEAQITRAEDALRQIVFDPKVPDFWGMTFELTDAPVFRARDVDLDAAVRAALDQRTDILNMRKQLESADINIRYYKNQALPDVSVKAGYGTSGQGGTEYAFDNSFPPVVTGVVDRGWGSVLSQMFGNDFHNWSLAVTIGYPLGRSNAQAALAMAQVSRSQSELQLKNLELSVATQVRETARTLNTNRKRVEATRVSRELAERKLAAEQKKFEAGMSTNFQVIQAQRDLATARNSELQAVLDYNRSLVDFETVQEAPLNGGGVTVSTGGQ